VPEAWAAVLAWRLFSQAVVHFSRDDRCICGRRRAVGCRRIQHSGRARCRRRSLFEGRQRGRFCGGRWRAGNTRFRLRVGVLLRRGNIDIRNLVLEHERESVGSFDSERIVSNPTIVPLILVPSFRRISSARTDPTQTTAARRARKGIARPLMIISIARLPSLSKPPEGMVSAMPRILGRVEVKSARPQNGLPLQVQPPRRVC